jgi:type II restriction enzyme
MIRALRAERFPHLFVLQYDPNSYQIHNLLLVPNFMISISAIIPRRPLRASARRAGWVGCSISLVNVPPEGRIAMISDETVLPPVSVRQRFRDVSPLSELPTEKRGWTPDVLTILRGLNRAEFSLQDVYEHAATLFATHPDNRHVHEKIRQQLQVLRDMGYIKFLKRGEYKWKK